MTGGLVCPARGIRVGSPPDAGHYQTVNNPNPTALRLAQAGDSPEGTRAADVITIGTLIVTAITSRPILTSILGMIRAYLQVSKARSIKIQLDGDSLEVTGLRLDDQRRLIESFIDRHTNVDE
jgi:hypothetical protein